MNFEYSRSNVAQGRQTQQKQQEEPNTFGTLSGADDIKQVTALDKPKQRMAGDMGERILEYMNDPMEAQRTDNWLNAFGMSNQGMEFNQAKMMMESGGDPGGDSGGDEGGNEEMEEEV